MKKNSDIKTILEITSLKYLAKYESSENQFRDYLQKKILKINPQPTNEIVETIVNDMKDMNYINDKRFSGIKSRQIFRNGGSKKFIIFKLKEKGICNSIIKQSIELLFDNKMKELAAALIYIKRKKIGIYFINNSDKEISIKLKNKWMGTLSRKGFPYEIVKKVFEIENIEDAENIINRMKY